MTLRMIKPLALVLGLGAALSACSNEPYFSSPVTNLYDVLFKNGEGAPAPITQQQIVQTLSATELPVAFLNIEKRKSQSLLVRIEQNPPYDTFATSTRQAVTMRHGMITGTRGLGGDLMSTDEGPLLAQVRSRQTGHVTHIQRFLTPEDVTEVITYRCGVEADKPVNVEMGLVRGTAVEVIAACESPEGPPFVDYYVVGQGGDILASRQWLGSEIGYVAMHMLRR